MMTTQAANVNRRVLAQELAAEIGAEVRYLGVPSCAYQVGPYTINRDASIDGDDLEAIRDFLIRHDYIHQEPAVRTTADDASDSEAHMAEGTSIAETSENDSSGAESDHLDSEEEQETREITETLVSIPMSELNTSSIQNLLRLAFAKQKLVNAMTQSNFLFIDEEVIDLLNDEKPATIEKALEVWRSEAEVGMIRGMELKDGKMTFIFPFNSEQPTAWTSYAKMILALVDRAKAAQHINAKRIDPSEEEMKYYCNSLLMQLGFGGVDFKADRATLLGHLTGYAAFKTTDKMEAHKAKFSELRKAARQMASQPKEDVDISNGEVTV